MTISRSLENLLLTHSTGSTLRDTDAIPIARSAKRVVWGMAGKVCCLSNFLVNADEFYVDSWWWFPTQKYSPHKLTGASLKCATFNYARLRWE